MNLINCGKYIIPLVVFSPVKDLVNICYYGIIFEVQVTVSRDSGYDDSKVLF